MEQREASGGSLKAYGVIAAVAHKVRSAEQMNRGREKNDLTHIVPVCGAERHPDLVFCVATEPQPAEVTRHIPDLALRCQFFFKTSQARSISRMMRLSRSETM